LTLKGIASGTSDAAVVVVPAGGLVTNGVTDISGVPTAAQIFVQGATVTISGSARQSGQMRNLRGFPESDEFGLSGGQALCL
jgi:hypothetical protein